jgi:hypothetical protein
VEDGRHRALTERSRDDDTERLSVDRSCVQAADRPPGADKLDGTGGQGIGLHPRRFREALIEAGRADLIGGCGGLIPANPPKEAIEAKRRQANEAWQGDHYQTVANPAKGEQPGERGAEPPKPTGYRPGRKTAGRRKKGKR